MLFGFPHAKGAPGGCCTTLYGPVANVCGSALAVTQMIPATTVTPVLNPVVPRTSYGPAFPAGTAVVPFCPGPVCPVPFAAPVGKGYVTPAAGFGVPAGKGFGAPVGKGFGAPAGKGVGAPAGGFPAPGAAPAPGFGMGAAGKGFAGPDTAFGGAAGFGGFVEGF